MNVPKVSVCVVTYNHARYIRDCLMSVLAQSEDVSLEILVGDDLSNDETGEIIQSLTEKYPKIFRYFRHIKRQGPLGNYQFLIKEARGEYIAHLDGDDFWLPGKLRRQIAILEENHNLIAAFSNAAVIDDDMTLKGGFNRFILNVFDLGFLLRRGNFLCNSSIVYRAKAKTTILNIATPCIDYQIHIQLAQQGSLGYINSTLVGYRVASTTSMSLLQTDNVRELYWQALVNIEKSPQLNQDIGSAMTQFFFISSWNLAAVCQFKPIYKIWNKVTTNIPISRFKFLYLLFQFFIEHLLFKLGNFLCKKAFNRPLKIYFNR